MTCLCKMPAIFRSTLLGTSAFALLFAGEAASAQEPRPSDESTRRSAQAGNTQRARDRVQRNQDQARGPSGNERQNSSDYQTDESPGLGVVVQASPAGAVFVMDTIMGSPADQAGIAHGDYLTAVNGQKVSSPAQFCRTVSDLEPGKEVAVTIWREGEEMTRQLVVASQADQLPESEKAWLGVMLLPTDEDGLLIERVISGSPADEAGLQRGDRILRYDGKDITDIQSFVESLEELEPHSELDLTIQRQGAEKEVTVTLAHLHDAPLRFLRQATGTSSGGFDDRGYLGGGPGMTQQLVGELRQRVRKLEQEVDMMRQKRAKQDRPQRRRPTEQSRQQDVNRDSSSQSDNENDFSSLRSRVDNVVTVLAQRRGDDWRRGGFRERGQGNRGWDGRSYRYGDRDRFRDYGYRDWRSSRYPSRSPLYRSPRYDNRYYRYGGVPYYYNGYGLGRSGFRIGNFGVYWY